MVKTPFINLKERVLLRDKTVILKDLFAGEGKLIDLVINNDGNSDLGKDAAPEKFINSFIIFDFNLEILEINYYGFNLKVKFSELNFVNQTVNLIPKTFNE